MSVFELTGGQYANIPGPSRAAYCVTDNPDGPVRPMINLNYNLLRGANAHYPDAPAASSVLGLLSAKTGVAFDLPGEAEWEYACRAGNGSGYWNDGSAITRKFKTWGTTVAATRWDTEPPLSNLARYARTGGTDFSVYGSSGTFFGWQAGTDEGSAPVGSYAPNTWGLYDMHGNAMEICLDYYKEDITGDNGAINVTDNGEATHVARGGSLQLGPISCRSAARTPRAAGYSLSEIRTQCDGCRLVLRIGGAQ